MYPIQRGAMVNFAAFRARYDLEHSAFKGPWVQDVPPGEVVREFAGWEDEVQVLLQVRFFCLCVAGYGVPRLRALLLEYEC